MVYKNIEIIKTKNGFLETKTLDSKIQFNIRLKCVHNNEGEFRLIHFFIDYVLTNNPFINDQETISYGLWLLKFVQVEDKFEIFEFNDSFTDWSEGADNAVYYYELQKQTCNEENADFKVPLFTQKVAINEGVLQGKNVQGIRYNEPSHMSGWYLTTAEYDGNIKNMKVIELQTLVKYRKDLLQFLALPPGFVFETLANNECRIWKYPEITENISGS